MKEIPPIQTMIHQLRSAGWLERLGIPIAAIFGGALALWLVEGLSLLALSGFVLRILVATLTLGATPWLLHRLWAWLASH